MSSNIDDLPDVRGVYKFSEPLKKYTWLGVGGKAEILFEPQDEDDLQYFIQHKPQDMPIFILGGGSNLLVRDGGIAGVVIKLKNANFAQWRVVEDKFICGAGLINFNLKKILPANCLGGLEFLCSIPGTIGGAFRSNAGCFGSELSQVLECARVMDGCGKIFNVDAADFHFAYRHSEFPTDWIILEACFKIVHKSETEISAQILQNDEYRRTHQPQGIKTAGSTFKNPPQQAAWKLIKAAGGDHMVVGGAHMSAQHCNFLQNDGDATAEDIEKLGNQIIEAVKKQSGIELEWEIKRVGRNINNG